MAKVLAVLKAYPKDIDVNLDEVVVKVKEKLPDVFELVKHEKVYVAFGLHVLRLYIVMPEDFEGGTEKLEDFLKGIDGIESIEVELVTRTEAF